MMDLLRKLRLTGDKRKAGTGVSTEAPITTPSSKATPIPKTPTKKRSINFRSRTISSPSSPHKPSRPLFGRAVSDTYISKPSAADIKPTSTPTLAPRPTFIRPSLPVVPPSPPSPVVMPLVRTYGPTQLRSVLPSKKSTRLVRPKTARHSIDETPPFATGRPLSRTVSPSPQAASSSMTTSSSAPALSTIPASPVDSTKESDPSSPASANVTTAERSSALLQRPALSPFLGPLPSPGESEYGTEINTPSPGLGWFTLGTIQSQPSSSFPFTQQPEVPSTADIPSDESPTPAKTAVIEMPVFRSTRTTPLRTTQSTFFRLADKRPMALDLSTATRKPRARQPTCQGFIETLVETTDSGTEQSAPGSPVSKVSEDEGQDEVVGKSDGQVRAGKLLPEIDVDL